MQNEFMTITDNNGKELKCKIIFTHYNEEFKHNYVVFQIEETDEITAMIFEETDNKNGKLLPIENDAEWDLLQDVLEDFLAHQEEHEHEHSCGCHCSECCEGDCCDADDEEGEDHCGSCCGCHDCE